MYPFLSLADVHLDADLARRLPRRLAYYHLALPIAQDADGITVAMAHPEYPKVILVLEAALGARIIPVRSFAETIRQQLDGIWHDEPQAQPTDSADKLRVTHWGQTEKDIRFSVGYVGHFLSMLGREIQLEIVVSSEYSSVAGADLIIAAGDNPTPDALFHSSATLLVVGTKALPPRRILHVLRGHIPDYKALDWLIPISRQGSGTITLLMGVDGYTRKPPMSDLSNILLMQDKRNTHIAECRRRLNAAGVGGKLKIRQGELLTAISEEVHEHSYDLVGIAAEAYGDFAQQVSERVRYFPAAFLVIKP